MSWRWLQTWCQVLAFCKERILWRDADHLEILQSFSPWMALSTGMQLWYSESWDHHTWGCREKFSEGQESLQLLHCAKPSFVTKPCLYAFPIFLCFFSQRRVVMESRLMLAWQRVLIIRQRQRGLFSEVREPRLEISVQSDLHLTPDWYVSLPAFDS